VTVAEPPLLVVTVPTYTPGSLGTMNEVLTSFVCPAATTYVLEYVASVIPLRVMVRVPTMFAVCVPQLLMLPAIISVLPGLSVTLLLPFTVNVSGVHWA